MSKGSEKGESVGAKDTPSIADYYSSVTGNAGLSEGKASGGKSATGGAPAASTASSAGRGGPSSADVGKGSVSAGAKGMGGEGPSGMPAIGAPSVGRSATMGGPGIGPAPTVMGSDRAPSRAGFGAFMSSPRAAEDVSMRSYRAGIMPTTARAAETMSMNRHTAIQSALTTIRAHEAGKTDPYNRLVDPERGYRTPSHADLTKMTIAEVMEYQKGMKAAGHKSSAVGAYQIIAPTLVTASRLAGVDPQTTKFSPAVQDRLAIALMDERARQATRDGRVDVTTFADRLADEWAAFKNSSGGGSYDGDGRNRASVDFLTVYDLAGDLVESGAIQPSSRGSAATTPSVSLPNPGPIPAAAPIDRPGAINLPETMAAPAGRPADAPGGFGRFMGDSAQFGPSPRSMEGPGGIYLDAPPAQQPNMTVPPMGFSGGQTPRGQEEAASSRQTPFGPSPRSMEGPGGIMLDYVPETARPSRPDQFEAQPERGGKADIDPGQERRDRRADRIDKALPWIAGPIAGAVNESRAKSGKSTFGDWLSDLLDGKGGSGAVFAPEGSGEGVSVVTPIAAANPTPPTTGTSQWLLDILDEPKRPTPRQKWGRGLMPS